MILKQMNPNTDQNRNNEAQNVNHQAFDYLDA